MRKIIDHMMSGIVAKNIKFLNKHQGEDCYLIGNGASIRHFDLSAFSDKVSFGCNELRIHNDIGCLNLKYYVGIHPLSYSKYWRGNQTGMYLERNPLYEHTHSFNDNSYEMFVHASNYPFTKCYGKFNYVHNMMKHPMSLDTLNFSSSSSFAVGGLEGMLGLAIYMGFKKIYLVGCDYWFTPRGETHFYSLEESYYVKSEFLYKELLDIVSQRVELIVVTRNGVRSEANYVEYSELTGKEERQSDSSDIVSGKYLSTMASAQYLRG